LKNKHLMSRIGNYFKNTPDELNCKMFLFKKYPPDEPNCKIFYLKNTLLMGRKTKQTVEKF